MPRHTGYTTVPTDEVPDTSQNETERANCAIDSKDISSRESCLVYTESKAANDNHVPSIMQTNVNHIVVALETVKHMRSFFSETSQRSANTMRNSFYIILYKADDYL